MFDDILGKQNEKTDYEYKDNRKEPKTIEEVKMQPISKTSMPKESKINEDDLGECCGCLTTKKEK